MCFGCKKKEDPQISFYYWNTIFNIDKTEQNYLDTLKGFNDKYNQDIHIDRTVSKH